MDKVKILPSAIEIPLDPKTLEEMVSKAKDYALMQGICMRSKTNFNEDALFVSNDKFDDFQG